MIRAALYFYLSTERTASIEKKTYAFSQFVGGGPEARRCALPPLDF